MPTDEFPREDFVARAAPLFPEDRDQHQGITVKRVQSIISLTLMLSIVLGSLAIAFKPWEYPAVQRWLGLSNQAKAAPTGAPTNTATNTVERNDQIFPATGWIASTLPFATTIAFAPSDPAVAYACGGGTLPDTAQPITLATSHDGGTTWHEMKTDVALTDCHLSIDPRDPQDLLLSDLQCPAEHGQCPFLEPTPIALYRSRDGGSTWHQLQLPVALVGVPTIGNYMWAGAMLYLASTTIVKSPNHSYWLAASRAGGEVTWLEPPIDTATYAYTDGAVLYLANIALNGLTLLKASSTGDTWSLYTFQPYEDQIPGIIATSGNAWFSIEDVATTRGFRLLETLDAGQHWRSLPSAPAPYTFEGADFARTADGTIIVTFGATSMRSKAIYASFPNTSVWLPIAFLPAQYAFRTVAIDMKGHPAVLWSGYAAVGRVVPHQGLQYHVVTANNN